EYALRSPISQQHRNKLATQARLLGGAAANPCARILVLACGSALDVQMALPSMQASCASLVLNDIDADALAAARQALHNIESRCEFHTGNAVRFVASLGRVGATFDLVLAGGLFDYLPDKHVSYVVSNIYDRLLT